MDPLGDITEQLMVEALHKVRISALHDGHNILKVITMYTPLSHGLPD